MSTRKRTGAETALFCVVVFSPLLCSAQVRVTPDHPSGVYSVGQTVRWTLKWQGASPPPPKAHYIVKQNGLKEVGRGDVDFTADGPATLQTGFDAPGTMLVEVDLEARGNMNRAFGGAVADPEKITAASPAPDDFDAFWKAKVDELSAVPPNAKLDEAAAARRDGVKYAKITLDNIRATHIQGQVAWPSAGEKFPGLLILQWAGVYPLQKKWVTDRAAEGWLALNILPHDLPIDQPESFYKDQYAGPLKNYWAIGNDDPDKSYYLRMYLSCVRAQEYLRSRPDWDGKTLVIMGASQGGQQALMLAGLHPDGITAALPFLPAGCDMLGPDVGRASGFPFWYTQIHDGRDAANVRAASRYYDPINFARHIKCPVLIGTGLHDDLAPPSSVLAAANVITSPKEVIILPDAGHQDEHGSQAPYTARAYGAWLPALREGKPVPPPLPSAPPASGPSLPAAGPARSTGDPK
jgi:cephalosporin-C deacetylase